MLTEADPEPIEYTVPSSWMNDTRIYTGILATADPIDYFDLFLIRDILEQIVEQTILFDIISQRRRRNSQARTHAWYPVIVDEVVKFSL